MHPMNLNELAMRPARYWLRDGLVEIFLGLLMLVPSILFSLAARLLPKGSPLALSAPLGWLAAILALKWGLQEMKARVVSPRGGYIALPEPGKAARIGVVAVVFLSGALYTIFGPFARLDQSAGSLAGAVLALIFSACFFAGWIQARLPHMLLLAAVPPLAEIWIYRSGRSFREAMVWILVAQGGALVLSGSLRFRNFLKANPRGDFGA
jgi:hypothetical protein